MAPTLTNPIPAAVTAGDSIAWAWSDSLHTSGDGWAPTLTLVNAAGRITVAGVASGDAHTLTAAAAVTALWAPGTYRAHLAVARAGERETLFAQDLEVLPDPAGAALYDGRSHARRTLDALASMRPRLIAVDDSPSRNRLFLLKIWRFLRGLCAHTFLGVRVKQNSTRQLGEMLHVFNSLRRCERWPRQCLALERSRPLGGKERGLGGVRR